MHKAEVADYARTP